MSRRTPLRRVVGVDQDETQRLARGLNAIDELRQGILRRSGDELDIRELIGVRRLAGRINVERVDFLTERRKNRKAAGLVYADLDGALRFQHGEQGMQRAALGIGH